MAENDQDQKTEQATEKKLSEAMERGQIAKSPELTVLFPLAALLGGLGLTLHSASREIADYSVGMFTRFAHTTIASDTVTAQLGEAMRVFGKVIAPLLVGIVGAVLLQAACRADSSFRRRRSDSSWRTSIRSQVSAAFSRSRFLCAAASIC
jgi:flagellar biosynthetic protein FlhB